MRDAHKKMSWDTTMEQEQEGSFEANLLCLQAMIKTNTFWLPTWTAHQIWTLALDFTYLVPNYATSLWKHYRTVTEKPYCQPILSGWLRTFNYPIIVALLDL